MMAAIIEEAVVGSCRDGESVNDLPPDPEALARTATSPGSYCLRWELVLMERRLRKARAAHVRYDFRNEPESRVG